MQVEGKLVEKLEMQTGSGRNGEWKKQDFVIETAGDRFPKKICITAWSDMIAELETYKMGDQLKVDIDLSSREYNGRWYTDVKAWRMSNDGGASSAAPSGSGSGSAAPAPAAPLPKDAPMEDLNEEDDLPF
jgi:hypothetical protein